MRTEGKTGSLFVSAFFVAAGLVTLWDTQSYSDSDSQVFPQAVAIALVLCAALTFVTTLMRGGDGGGFGDGIWWRRGLLIASLLGACLLMPAIGFLPSGVIAFAGGLAAAMHDDWTVRKFALYSISGLLVMSTFYALFRYVLLVPLP